MCWFPVAWLAVDAAGRLFLDCVLPPRLANKRGKHVESPHDTRDNTVSNDLLVRRRSRRTITPRPPRKPEPQATVNHAQRDADPSQPDMQVARSLPPSILPEQNVVQESKDGLKEQQRKQQDANNSMRITQQPKVRRHPHAHTKRRRKTKVCHDLKDAVEQPQAREREQADHHAADGEQDDEGERGEHGVGGQDFGGFFKVKVAAEGTEAAVASAAAEASAVGVAAAATATEAAVLRICEGRCGVGG